MLDRLLQHAVVVVIEGGYACVKWAEGRPPFVQGFRGYAERGGAFVLLQSDFEIALKVPK